METQPLYSVQCNGNCCLSMLVEEGTFEVWFVVFVVDVCLALAPPPPPPSFCSFAMTRTMTTTLGERTVKLHTPSTCKFQPCGATTRRNPSINQSTCELTQTVPTLLYLMWMPKAVPSLIQLRWTKLLTSVHRSQC